MRKLSDVMGRAIGRKEVLRGGRAQLAMRRWPDIVGPILALHSEAERYDHGTLWVRASGSAWAQEIRLQQELILERLNEVAAEPLFQALRVGVRPVKQEPPTGPSKPEPA